MKPLIGTGQTSNRPRIGLDLHVVDGIYQGSRTHCLELFSRVTAITKECDFVLFCAEPQKLIKLDRFGCSNAYPVVLPSASPAKRLLWQLARLTKQHRIDLLHTQYITPPFSPCPTAVTVHDILFNSHPQYFDKLFVMRSNTLVPRSVRKSVQVFTVSEFSRRQISDVFGIDAEKVHTIPNAVDGLRFSPGEQGRPLVASVGLEPGRYFLTVGRLEPRKNHKNILRAWAKLPQPRPHLAIVGQRHFGYADVLNLIPDLRLERDVTFLENVSDVQLPAVLRNARGFIYCSWAEGFGMPVLEAMASGIPVICSNTTALSEICSDAALLVPPEDTEAISDAIRQVHTNENLREVLIERGLRRVGDFSWDHSAAILRESYLKYFSTAGWRFGR